MTAAGSNRLPVLAAETRQALVDIAKATATASEKSFEVGNALLEAKAIVKHGEWLPFLTDIGIQERTAQRYMTLAGSDLKSDTVSLLGGMTAALRFLRLRAAAGRHLDAAEAAALQDAGDDICLPPLEAALDIIDEMVGMFPAEITEGGGQA